MQKGEYNMLDDQKRLTISLGLIEHSNLKGAKTVLIAFDNKELLLIPETEKPKQGVRVYWVKTIDEKGRIIFPNPLVEISSEWTPCIVDGEIRVEPKPGYAFE